jgi:HAD superfamily hydrolase (TIGR01509 family)
MNSTHLATGSFAGVLFDFNGVLFLDACLQEQAWNELACAIRGSHFSDEEVRQILHGRTNRDILSHLLGKSPNSTEMEALSNFKEKAYRSLCIAAGEECRLAPGAIHTLDSLRAANIRLAIATSSPKDNVNFFIHHMKIDYWFDKEAIVYDDGSFPGKPAPDVYLRAAAQLGLAPSECVAIDDAISGIKSADRAGCGRVVAFGSPSRHVELAQVPGVAMVISDLTQLPLRWFSPH